MKRRRILALLIAFVMVFQLIPALSLANEGGEGEAAAGQTQGAVSGEDEALQTKDEEEPEKTENEPEEKPYEAETEPTRGNRDVTYEITYKALPEGTTVDGLKVYVSEHGNPVGDSLEEIYNLPMGKYYCEASSPDYAEIMATAEFAVENGPVTVELDFDPAPVPTTYEVIYTVLPEDLEEYDLKVYQNTPGDLDYLNQGSAPTLLPEGTYHYHAVGNDQEITGTFTLNRDGYEVTVDLRGTPPEPEVLAYAVFTNKDRTLYFYRDDQWGSTTWQGEGITVFLQNGQLENMGTTVPDWINDAAVRPFIEHVSFAPSFAAARPKSMYHWFENCTAFTGFMVTWQGTNTLTYLNTSQCINMEATFKGCTALTSLDLNTSTFITSSVTTMSQMFMGCSNLQSLNLSGFNTAYVWYMDQMFKSCGALTTLQRGANFTTGNVRNMSQMFMFCSSFTSLNLTGFQDTGNVIDMSQMFWGCSNLGENSGTLNISNFNTANVDNMYGMFGNCSKLTSAALDLSSFNTAGVTNMSWMFFNCSALGNLPSGVSSFNVAAVETFQSMFYGCSNLVMLSLENWQTTSALNMQEMFAVCSKANQIYVTNFDTSYVTNMASMFAYCSKLTTLDLRSFDTQAVAGASRMFYECSLLHTIYVSENFVLAPTANGNGMFQLCKELVGGAGTALYNELDLYGADIACGANYAIIDRVERATANSPETHYYGYFTDFNDKDHENLGTSNSGDPKKFKVGEFEEVGFFVYVPLPANHYPRWTFQTGAADEDLPVIRNSSTYSDYTYFWGYTDVVGGNLLTSLDDPDLVNYAVFSMPPITGSANWYVTGNEKELHIGTLEEDIPANYAARGTLNFNETYVPVSIPYRAFNDKVESIFIDNLLAPTLMCCWFVDFSVATSFVGLNYIVTNNVTNMAMLFAGCNSVTALEYEDIGWWNTSNVENMAYLFAGCEHLASLDVSSFNTSSVLYMQSMFSGCSALEELDVSSFDTHRVLSMANMFYGCSKLTGLNLSSFNTSRVTNMSYMFYDCRKLTGLNLSSFNTSKVTDMSYMFYHALEYNQLNPPSLDLSNFDTSLVADMSYMFSVCGAAQFDLLSFTVDSVSNASYMFRSCYYVNTIYADDWFVNFPNGANTTRMFENCVCLVGGDGTLWDYEHIDGERALVDQYSRTGYFTGDYAVMYSESPNHKFVANAIDPDNGNFNKYFVDQNGILFVHFTGYDGCLQVFIKSLAEVTWDAPKCLFADDYDDYRDYVFIGYTTDLSYDTALDYSAARDENYAMLYSHFYAMFAPPEVFKTYVQYRRYNLNPVQYPNSTYTDLRVMTSIPEELWTGPGLEDSNPPVHFQKIGFRVRIYNQDDPSASWVLVPYGSTEFDDAFYRKIRGNVVEGGVDLYPETYFNATISKNIALLNVQSIPKSQLQGDGTLLYFQPVFVTLDGTRSKGPGQVFRVFYNNGIKWAERLNLPEVPGIN